MDIWEADGEAQRPIYWNNMRWGSGAVDFKGGIGEEKEPGAEAE